jgi:hypothetical protein
MVIAAAIMLGAGIIAELFAIAGAPLGYQDEQGFHIGAADSEDNDHGRMA